MRDAMEPGSEIAPDRPDSPAGLTATIGEGRRPIPTAVLARIFLEIGVTSFGGLGPSLAIIERELVDKRSILTAADIAEAVAATRLLPGSTLIQVLSFLGYRIRGWTGSVVATAACVLPPALAMVVLAVSCETLSAHPAFGPAARGLTAAVIGTLLATMCRFGRATIGGPVALGVALCAFGSASVLRVPAAVVVVAAGLIGIRMLSPSRTDRGSGSRRGGRS